MCTTMRNHFPWRGCLARLLQGSFFMLALMLVSEATPRAHPLPRSSEPQQESIPSMLYLPVIGPPPLRFAQAPPPPDLSTRPAAVAPPLPTAGEDAASANTAGGRTNGPSRGGDGAGSEQGQPIAASSSPTLPSVAPKASERKEAQALLPDDTEHETRPEEILPFFQFPGSGGTTIVVPAVPVSNAPTRLPVSTAVYRER
jgi:hypothetical protein